MPEKAKVFVAEDDSIWRRTIKRRLSEESHEVVLEAETLAQALKSIEQFKELGVQVAVIDGNLNPYDSSGSDGAELAIAIKRLAPEVKMVGMSGATDVFGVDINLGKAGIRELGRTITNL